MAEETSTRTDDESSCESEDDTPTGSTPCVVVFKCIGSNRDPCMQSVLHQARDRMLSGLSVPERMTPEPTNIVDSRAIVFEFQLNRKWEKIGYVVDDYVHSAITGNLIMSVEFKCIKYVTHWTR